MASNLGNLIVPQTFARYVAAERDKLNAFVKSGAAVALPALSTMLAGGAKSFTLPFWKNLSATGLVPTTDYAVNASAQTMSAGSQIALRVQRAITPIAVTDLEGSLISEDPIAEAARQVAEIHNEIRQSILIAQLTAVTNVDGADAGTVGDLNYVDAGTALSGTMLTKAIANMWGDAVRGLAGLTLVMNSLEFLDLQSAVVGATGIAFPNAVDVGFGTFMGATVVVDDTVAADTVFIIKRGGLAFGQASVATPVETERKPGAGNAAGADILVIGRAITGAADPVQAAHDILESLR